MGVLGNSPTQWKAHLFYSDNMQVRDAVCLVTGSAQGLGKAFAVRLLAAGAKVCISDVREEGGLATLKELREKFGEDKVTFVQCDVTKPEQFSKLFDECEAYFKVKCIDLSVNNAGINTNLGWRKCMEMPYFTRRGISHQSNSVFQQPKRDNCQHGKHGRHHG